MKYSRPKQTVRRLNQLLLLRLAPLAEPALRPPRQKLLLPTLSAGILIAFCGLGYWKHVALTNLFNLTLPYVPAASFTTLGIVGLRYKDWNKYKHPFAARAELGMFIVFGILMAFNTYREREVTKGKDKANADTINGLRADLSNARQEMKTNAGNTTQSLTSLSSELRDFKDKVKPDEIRSEMSRSSLHDGESYPSAQSVSRFYVHANRQSANRRNHYPDSRGDASS